MFLPWCRCLIMSHLFGERGNTAALNTHYYDCNCSCSSVFKVRKTCPEKHNESFSHCSQKHSYICQVTPIHIHSNEAGGFCIILLMDGQTFSSASNSAGREGLMRPRARWARRSSSLKPLTSSVGHQSSVRQTRKLNLSLTCIYYPLE